MTDTANKATTLVLATFAMLAWLVTSRAQPIQPSREAQALILTLAAPIAMKGIPPGDGRDPRLADVVRSNDGSTVFLVTAAPYAQLLVGVNRTGFGTPIPLSMKAYGLRIAEGTGGVLWVGGLADAMVSIISTHLSHAYLAKVDRQGRLLWERHYGEQSERSIQSVSALASGDVVVSGKENDRTWLAKISSDGNVIWERFVGIGKGSTVATQDGVILLAAIDLCMCNEAYREDLAVWAFDQAGAMVDHQFVRQGINSNPRESAAQIEFETADDSIFVLSVWAAFQAKPLEVTKLNAKRELIWTKSFPRTVWRRGNFSGANLPARGLLSNGDIVLAMREQLVSADFVLSRLDAATGDLSETLVRMPPAPPAPCAERWGPIDLLQEKPEGKVLLFGSPPDGRGPRSCGWIGEAALPKFQQ
jgi:hypothetical protein